MTTKEELLQYRFKIKKVDEALEEYETYKTRAEKMTAIIGDGTGHSNKISDKVGDNATIMADISKLYEKRWLDAENERLAILSRIDELKEPYRSILSLRYIQNKRLEAIAEELNYSYVQIKRLHGHALQMYRKDDTK